MLVLKGNIPRFSWEPSTTMLTYRLKGTTDVPVSNRTGRANCRRFRRSLLTEADVRPSTQIFGRPGEPHALGC
jgi:hypothetical protein